MHDFWYEWLLPMSESYSVIRVFWLEIGYDSSYIPIPEYEFTTDDVDTIGAAATLNVHSHKVALLEVMLFGLYLHQSLNVLNCNWMLQPKIGTPSIRDRKLFTLGHQYQTTTAMHG